MQLWSLDAQGLLGNSRRQSPEKICLMLLTLVSRRVSTRRTAPHDGGRLQYLASGDCTRAMALRVAHIDEFRSTLWMWQ